MTLKQNIANNLKFTRIFLDLTQTDIEKITKISRSKLSKIEQGHTSPNAEDLLALSQLYSVSIDWIFNNDSTLKSSPSGGNMWELRQP